MVPAREATADAVVRVSPSGRAIENRAGLEKGALSGHLSKRWSNKQVRLDQANEVSEAKYWTGISCGTSWRFASIKLVRSMRGSIAAGWGSEYQEITRHSRAGQECAVETYCRGECRGG